MITIRYQHFILMADSSDYVSNKFTRSDEGAWWLTPQTQDPEFWGSSPTHVAVLCPCARHIYPQKVLVIPRKLWLSPNMTEKLFTGTLSIKTNQIKIHKEDLKTWGITLGLETEGDTQGFPCILRDLINNDNRGIKHDFPFINKKFARSRGKC